jgi:hypothetical protein
MADFRGLLLKLEDRLFGVVALEVRVKFAESRAVGVGRWKRPSPSVAKLDKVLAVKHFALIT